MIEDIGLKNPFDVIENVVKNVFGLNKIKVCIVCNPGMGGSGIVGSNIASDLSERGHDVHLISQRRPFALKNKKVKTHLISVKPEHVLQYFPIIMSAASKLYDVVKVNDIDIINVHYAIPYSTASYLAREMFKSEGRKLPIVTTVHGTDIHTIGQKTHFKNVVRFTLKSSDGIIAVSDYLSKQIKDKFDIDNEVKVIYNYVDTDRFSRKEYPKTKKLIGEKEKIIMHASNFRSIKNIGDIVDSFKIIRKNSEAKLILVGDGPEMKNIKKKVRKYGLVNDVIFTGPKKNIEKFFSISDVFVLPSLREGCPLSILEAMSCSVPIVATKVGGIPEIVDNGKNGFLVDVGDVREISDKILKIIQDDHLRESMGDAGRRMVLNNFTSDKIIPQYENYYRKLILD